MKIRGKLLKDSIEKANILIKKQKSILKGPIFMKG